MKVNYNVVGFTADQKLVDFIQKKMDKLDLFYDKVIDADVYLKLENTNAKENKIIEIKVNVPGDNFVVKKQCKTFEEAMDLSVNPIERFLKKYKETR
jgi:30S ribosomal protein S21